MLRTVLLAWREEADGRHACDPTEAAEPCELISEPRYELALPVGERTGEGLELLFGLT